MAVHYHWRIVALWIPQATNGEIVVLDSEVRDAPSREVAEQIGLPMSDAWDRGREMAEKTPGQVKIAVFWVGAYTSSGDWHLERSLTE